MDSNKDNWVTRAGGWDGLAIVGIAFLIILIGCCIAVNGHAPAA